MAEAATTPKAILRSRAVAGRVERKILRSSPASTLVSRPLTSSRARIAYTPVSAPRLSGLGWLYCPYCCSEQARWGLRARQDAIDGREQLGRAERLVQAADRSEPGRHVQEVRRTLRRKTKLLPGDDDDRHVRPRLMNEFHRLEAIHPWHENIDDEQVKGLCFDELKAGPTVVDGFNRMARALEQDLDRGKNCPIVIDD